MAKAAPPAFVRLAVVLSLWSAAAVQFAHANNESWGSLGMSQWTDGSVYALTVWNGQLIAAGDFDVAGGTLATNIARWDGESWHALDRGVGHINTPHRVVTMVEFEGDLVIGGAFLSAGDDDSINHIARWDGAAWSGMGADLLFNQDIHVITVYNGELIAGGDFNAIGSRPAARIARYGGSWRPMGQGLSTSPRAFIQFEGDLVVGGPFITADGLPAPTIARWVNGTNWEAMGQGFQARPDRTARVLSLAYFGDELYAGGHFIRSGTNSAQGIARWNGEDWVGLSAGGINSDDGQFWVRSMTEFEGELYVGGYMDDAGELGVNDIARYDGSAWGGLGSGTNNYVRKILHYDEKLFIAGDFEQAGGQTVHYLGTWQNRSVSIGEEEEFMPTDQTPVSVALLPNWPNPFNPATTLRFSLPERGPVVLRILDLRGSLVRTLEDRVFPAGQHHARWDGLDTRGLPTASGVYLVQLDASNRRLARKITLVR